MNIFSKLLVFDTGPHKTMIYLKDVVSVSVGDCYTLDPISP